MSRAEDLAEIAGLSAAMGCPWLFGGLLAHAGHDPEIMRLMVGMAVFFFLFTFICLVWDDRQVRRGK